MDFAVEAQYMLLCLNKEQPERAWAWLEPTLEGEDLARLQFAWMIQRRLGAEGALGYCQKLLGHAELPPEIGPFLRGWLALKGGL